MYEIIIEWIKQNKGDLNIGFEKAGGDYKRNDIFITRLAIQTNLHKKQIEKFFKPLLEFYIGCKLEKGNKSKYSKLNNYLLEIGNFIQ